MSSALDLEKIIDNVSSSFKICLRDFQRKCMKAVLEGNDVFVCVPTGHGKTFCYSLLAHSFFAITGKKSVILVISPLISLMKDQCSRLVAMGIKAAFIESEQHDEIMLRRLTSCDFEVLLVSPEAITSASRWRTILTGQNYIQSVRTIVVDEAHCIVEWGTEFRPRYAQLGELRAIYEDNVTLLCLTATSTITTKNLIERSLNMIAPVVVYVPPDRENIYYHFQQTKEEEYQALDWIIDGIKTKGNNFGKTILYCRSVDKTAAIYSYFKRKLGNYLFSDGNYNGSPCKLDYKLRRIGMFHRGTAAANKELILNSFPKEDSMLKVVIATSAFGLGVDVPDVVHVVFFGCPRTIESFAQQSGRAGRKGQQSYAILYFQTRNISDSGSDEPIADLCTTDNQCKRNSLVRHFSWDAPTSLNCALTDCKCCHVCRISCTCGSCLNLPWET